MVIEMVHLASWFTLTDKISAAPTIKWCHMLTTRGSQMHNLNETILAPRADEILLSFWYELQMALILWPGPNSLWCRWSVVVSTTNILLFWKWCESDASCEIPDGQEFVHAWADWIIVTARIEHKHTTFSRTVWPNLRVSSFNLTDSFSTSLRFQRKK